MRPNPQETADLVAFTGEILNGKLHFLCSEDHEHMRRLRKSTIAPNMSLELENIFSAVSQKAFLSNSYEKQKFIDLLAVQL